MGGEGRPWDFFFSLSSFISLFISQWNSNSLQCQLRLLLRYISHRLNRRPKSDSGALVDAEDQARKKLETTSYFPADTSCSSMKTKAVPNYKASNGFLVAIKEPRVIYRECRKNHAASLGGYAFDGCREFMAAGEEGTSASLRCAACSCHRSFHKREVEDIDDQVGDSSSVSNTTSTTNSMPRKLNDFY